MHICMYVGRYVGIHIYLYISTYIYITEIAVKHETLNIKT